MKVLYRKNWNFLMGAHKNRKLTHALLFCGLAEVGKFDFALEAARKIGGFGSNAAKLSTGADPDFFVVQPEIETKKNFFKEKKISIEQLKPVLEKTKFFPYQARQKFLVIKKIEMMTVSAANSILKLIEEPVPDLKIILTAENEQSVLPTIKSRCQILRFGLASEKLLREYVCAIHQTRHSEKKITEKNIAKIINLSGGRAKLAERLLEDEEFAIKLEEKIKNFRTALRGGIYQGLKFSEKESADKQQLVFSIDHWIIYLGEFLKKTIRERFEKKIQKKVLFMIKELLEVKRQLKNTNASERLLLDNYFVKINW